MEHAFGEGRRPCQSDTRLNVVLVPVVHGFAAICWSRLVENNGIAEVVSLGSSRKPHTEVIGERDSWLNLEPLRFINWAFQAVAQASRERQAWTDLPDILEISFVRLGSKIAIGRSALSLRGSVFPKREYGAVLGKATNKRSCSVLNLIRRAQSLICVFISRQSICVQIRLE